jgi:2,3-bisphosphoglycerate-dependent phosphoglycerate mutase
MQHTLARVRPYWEEEIQPQIKQGRRILIVSHRNTLRVLTMMLENLTPLQVMKSRLATGRPLVYELSQSFNVTRRYYVDTLIEHAGHP